MTCKDLLTLKKKGRRMKVRRKSQTTEICSANRRFKVSGLVRFRMIWKGQCLWDDVVVWL